MVVGIILDRYGEVSKRLEASMAIGGWKTAGGSLQHKQQGSTGLCSRC